VWRHRTAAAAGVALHPHHAAALVAHGGSCLSQFGTEAAVAHVPLLATLVRDSLAITLGTPDGLAEALQQVFHDVCDVCFRQLWLHVG